MAQLVIERDGVREARVPRDRTRSPYFKRVPAAAAAAARPFLRGNAPIETQKTLARIFTVEMYAPVHGQCLTTPLTLQGGNSGSL